MHTLLEKYPGGPWTVGMWVPITNLDNIVNKRWRWYAIRDFKHEADAAAYVSYLNGGPLPDFLRWTGDAGQEHAYREFHHA